MIFGGHFFHLQNEGMLPVKLTCKNLLLFYSTFPNDVLKELLKLTARNGAVLIIVAQFEDVVYGSDANIDSYFPKGSFHLGLAD